ncbi:MAG: grasp-with-spasm system ATP-grasp peptide maturase [Saprospiraceae bacterium]
MILIISEERDISTNHVIDWLIYYKQDYLRINISTSVTIKQVMVSKESEKIILKAGEAEFNLYDIKGYWYRRGWINFHQKVNFKLFENEDLARGIQAHLIHELSNIEGLIFNVLNQIPRKINKFSDSRYNNKLINLCQAKNVGLDIPNTLIASDKDSLEEFYKKNNEDIITKAVREGLGPYFKKTPYLSYTERVEKNDIRKATTKFFPSLFQKNIDKAYEIRVFYLVDKIYSTAIFSQRRKEANIDYRHYDFSSPDRFVPYQLPLGIEEKIHQFMNAINMSSGSLDFIATKNDSYVFLEVNPVGQYGGMVSTPSNYYLDKIIAKYLIGNE